MRRLATAALAVTAFLGAVTTASAQEEPPAQAPGCEGFSDVRKGPHEGPAYEAFLRAFIRYEEQSGIGPCWAPHHGGQPRPN